MASQILVNVGNDSVTGKKVKAALNAMHFSPVGTVQSVECTIQYYETDNSTPAQPGGGSQRQKQAVSSYNDRYEIGSKSILNTTRVYTPAPGFDVDGVTPNPNSVYLADYLANKAINSFPGVANGDPLTSLTTGLLKEIINVRTANNEIL